MEMTRLDKIKQVAQINQQIAVEDKEFEDRVLAEKMAELERLRDRIKELVALGEEMVFRKLPIINLYQEHEFSGDDKSAWTSVMGYRTVDSKLRISLRIKTSFSSSYNFITADSEGNVRIEYSYSNGSNFQSIGERYWEDKQIRETVDSFIDNFPIFETKVFDYIDNKLTPNKRKHETTVIKSW